MITENIISMLNDVAQKLRSVQDWQSNKSEVDYIYYKLDRLEHILSLSTELVNIDDRIYCNISAAKCLVGHLLQDEESVINFNMKTTLTGNRGRPRYIISKEQLQYFMEYGFKGHEMAIMLGVSEAKVRRRLQDFGLSSSTNFSSLTDEQLDTIVSSIKKDFVQSGYRMVQGILHARGYRVQERQVMESLRRVDIEGVIMRSLQLQTIRCRTYTVSGPNALWHLDTNHKLIRYIYIQQLI